MIYTVRKIRHSRLNPSRHCYTCARACACAENVRLTVLCADKTVNDSRNDNFNKLSRDRSPSRLSSNIDYMPISYPERDLAAFPLFR